jgi:hypothetical protein
MALNFCLDASYDNLYGWKKKRGRKQGKLIVGKHNDETNDETSR